MNLVSANHLADAKHATLYLASLFGVQILGPEVFVVPSDDGGKLLATIACQDVRRSEHITVDGHDWADVFTKLVSQLAGRRGKA